MATSVPPKLPAGERLRRAGMAAWSLIGLLILAALLVWVLLKVSIILPPLVFAVLIIYILNPVVARLETRGVRRGFAVALCYLGVVALLTGIVILLVPQVSQQVENFSEQSPRFRAEAIAFVEGTAARVEDRLGTEVDTTQIECLLGADDVRSGQVTDAPSSARCDDVTRQFRERIVEQAGQLTTIASSVLEVLLIFFLGPLLALYLLIDLPQLQRDVLQLAPPSHRAELSDLASKVGLAVGGFFRGQLLVALLVGVLSAVGFRLIGLPFWLVIGAVAGFFNIVPLIGPYIGGFLGFLVGTISGDLALGLKAALVELVVQQIDNHFISPNIMRRTVNIHPVTVILSILAGSAVAGFWGILLAVPGVAVLKVLFGHLWATRVLGQDVSPYAPASPSRAEAPSVVPEPEHAEGERATGMTPSEVVRSGEG